MSYDELRPFNGGGERRARVERRASELEATAFRCGSYSVRGPSSWASMRPWERIWGLFGAGLMFGAALAGLALPVVLVGLLVRAVAS